MDNWKKIVSLAIGLIMFAWFAYGDYSAISSAPEVAAVPLSNTVEKLAVNEGMNISEAAYLTNQFSESRGFGGAGGMGNNVVGAQNAESFIAMVKKEGLKEIYYGFEGKNSGIVKKYWAPSSKGVFEFSEFYKYKHQPDWISYSGKGYNSDEAVFEKDTAYSWIVFIFSNAIWSLMIYVIAYIMLGFLEKVYEILSI